MWKLLSKLVPSFTFVCLIPSQQIVPYWVINVFKLGYYLIFCLYAAIIWYYYESIDPTRKTVLTFLAQDMIIGMCFVRGYKLIQNLVIFFIKDLLANGFKSYPNLTCSLMSIINIELVNLCLLWLIFVFKILAKVNTTNFLEMDHDKVRKITNVSIISVTIIITFLLIPFYGSLCNKEEVVYLLKRIPGDYKMEDLKSIPSLQPFLVFLIILTVIIYNLVANTTEIRKNIFSNIGKNKVNVNITKTNSNEIAIIDLELDSDSLDTIDNTEASVTLQSNEGSGSRNNNNDNGNDTVTSTESEHNIFNKYVVTVIGITALIFLTAAKFYNFKGMFFIYSLPRPVLEIFC